MPKEIIGVKLYDVNEVATLLGVTQTTARNYIKKGALKAQKIGGKSLVSEDSLKEFLMSK